tara:strand:- start:254 stop:451 length:198 start_codon:yes stop_codon:yes gene_type:complete
MGWIIGLLEKFMELSTAWLGDRKQRRHDKKLDRTAEIHAENADAIDAALRVNGLSDSGSSGDKTD